MYLKYKIYTYNVHINFDLMHLAQTAGIVPDVLDALERLNKMILAKRVPTEGSLTMSSDGMDVYLDKGSASDMFGKTLTVAGDVSIDLPNYCTFMPDPCNQWDTVSIAVTIQKQPDIMKIATLFFEITSYIAVV